MGKLSLNIDDELIFLKRFNNRDCDVFGEVYTLFYNELIHYTQKLYHSTSVDACDVIQNVFVNLWQSKKICFTELYRVKAYLYISIRNEFKNYIAHQKIKDKYREHIIKEDNYDSISIIESEVYSLVQYLNILPEDCAKVMRLLVEGWSIKEISDEISVPERTVYHKKLKSISALKKRLSKDKLMLLLLLIK